MEYTYMDFDLQCQIIRNGRPRCYIASEKWEPDVKDPVSGLIWSDRSSTWVQRLLRLKNNKISFLELILEKKYGVLVKGKSKSELIQMILKV
jgi:hypothetical protein